MSAKTTELELATWIKYRLAMTQYVEERDGEFWITNSRVSLESVIYAFLNGFSPEAIVTESFPILSLEQVYGAISYYLGHRDKIDVYLQRAAVESARFQQEQHDETFARKMARARRSLQRA